MKRILCYVLSLVLIFPAFAQSDSLQNTQQGSSIATDTLRTNFPITQKTNQQVYTLKPGVDIPVFAIGAAWSGYAFTKIYSKPPSTEEQILNLNKNNINGFDRWAVRPYSKSLDRISYYPFFGSVPLPFLFLFGKDTHKDFFKLTFLYLEAMSVTGFFYTGSVYFADRYRPYAYSGDQSTIEQRTRGGAKNSFYAGHVALVATSTFFMAKVYADYHPDSKAKWVFYSLAGAATGVTAYLRYRAGQHFPSDLLLGTAQGTLTGLLVPQFHKHKLIKDPNLSIMPFGNGESFGFSCVYTIN
jgi:membrane-associated phospholipid phosphatase